MEDIDKLVEDIRKQGKMPNGGSLVTAPTETSMPISNVSKIDTDIKPSFSEITPYSENTVYATLSDKSKVLMYKDYIPGTDNNERLAQQQTTGEKWLNGIEKASKKTINAVVGGTAGIVYGLGSALSNGSMSNIYDNNFSNWLNDLDTKLNYQLPNYYTKQEQEKGVFGQVATANFWADKFLGGLSFTAGAIVSEAIWDFATGGVSAGTGLARLAERWGLKAVGEAGAIEGVSTYTKLFKGLEKGTEALETGIQGKKFAIGLGKLGDVGSITTKLARSAGYEASVEALQYKKEAEGNFYRQFQEMNGRPPTAEEKADFDQKNIDAANGVFMGNMAILMPSNLMMLGHTFGIKNPILSGVSDFIDRKAFGYGIEKATGEALKASTKQKIARTVFNYIVEPALTEGVFEEGMQSVVQKTANKWIEHTYDQKNMHNTFSTMEAFGNSIAEEYGTEKGWKDDILLGMITGIAGGAYTTYKGGDEKAEKIKYQETVGKTFNEKTLQDMVMPHRVQTLNRVQGFTAEAEQEAQKGNVVKSEMANKSSILAVINSELVMGNSVSDITEKLGNSLNSVTEEQWKKQGVEKEDIASAKEDRLKEIKDLASQFKTNKQYWQYIIGDKLVGEQQVTGALEEGLNSSFSSNAQMVEALAWQSTIGESAYKMMSDTHSVISKELGNEHAETLGNIQDLSQQDEKIKKEVSNLQSVYTTAQNEVSRLEKELVQRQAKLKDATEEQKAKYLQIEQKLIKAVKEVDKAKERADEIAKSLEATKNYSKDLTDINLSPLTSVTGEKLLNLNKNIEKFKNALKFQESADPQKAKYINDLLDEYQEAKSIFMQSQVTKKVLTASDFKFENISGYLSNRLKGKKDMNQNTKEWLIDSVKTYQKYKVKDINTSLEAQTDITEEDYNDFVDNGEVSQETLNNLAEKVKKGEKLTEKENAIFTDKTSEINDILKESSTKTKPKSQEQINQEKISALEAERRQKLANVKDIVVESTDIEAKKADIERKVDSLPDNLLFITHVTSEGNAEVIFNDNLLMPAGVSSTTGIVDKEALKQLLFDLAEGKSPHRGYLDLFVGAIDRATLENTNGRSLQDKLENYLDDNFIDDVAKTQLPSDLNIGYFTNGILNTKYDVENEKNVQTQTVTNQAEIDKINKEYDAKINTLKPVILSEVDLYRKRIKDMLNNVYYSLRHLPTDTSILDNSRPTKEDIEEYNQLVKDKKQATTRGRELISKLNDWKLISTATDNGYTSIKDMLDLINQLEHKIEKQTIKTEVTEEESLGLSDKEEVVDGSESRDDKTLGVNVLAPATVKFTKSGEVQLTHIKPRYIVEQIAQPYTIKRGKEIIDNSNIDELKVGDIVEIDNTSFIIDKSSRVVFSQKQFDLGRQQQLNLFVKDTKTTTWSFIDLYSIIGGEMQKTPSQFREDNLNPKKAYDLKKGDILTLHVIDTDNYNKTKDGDNFENFKIYLRDSEGNNVQVLKSGYVKVGNETDPAFLHIRKEAYKNWVSQGKPQKADLGISVEVDHVFLGSAELNFKENSISKEVTDKVIIAKGYILNGEITLDNKVEDINKSFVSKISKDNKDMKQPIVVFRVGINSVAFPITMTKLESPIDFDGLLTGSTQDMVKNINQAIIDNDIKAERLVFEDIVEFNGETQLSKKAQKVKEDFANHTSFTTADRIAEKSYKKEELTKDATIRIDLTDANKVFNAPKVRINLESAKIKQTKEIKYSSMSEIEDRLNTLLMNIYKTWANDYKDSKGDAIEKNTFSDVFAENAPHTNLKEGKDNTLKIANIKILNEAMKSVPKSFKEIFGEEKIQEVKRLLKQYENIKEITAVTEEDLREGIVKSTENCNG